MLTPAPPKSPFSINLDQPLHVQVRRLTETIEQHYIRKALKMSHGNIGRCAKICGLSRRTITAKMSEYSINKKKYKEV